MNEPVQPFASADEASAAFAEHVSRGKVETYRSYGIQMIMGLRGGPYFHDAYSDRRWLNCHCNGGVFNLGHHHPQVVAAVQQALSVLDIGNHHLVSGIRAALARRLAATTGGTLSGVVFGVSGGEAVDLAIKVVRAVTERPKVISAEGGYHGHTGLALAAGDPQYREPFGPNLPHFEQVPFDDLGALERVVDDDTAAVLLEPIPATLGMPIPSEGYLAGAQALCRERGARLIVDEIQTGLGRTGRLWAYQHEGIEPDALVTGKGLSGGVYPITATLMTPELFSFFDQHPFVHVSTFGGAEPACAAATAVLDLIEAPGFMDRVETVSDRLAAAFAPLPFELRRRGLMMGLKLGAEGAALMATKLLFEAGIFAVYANNDTSVLQLLPPLNLDDAQVEELVGKIRSVFS